MATFRSGRDRRARPRWALDLPYGDAARIAGLGEHGPPERESPLRKEREK